MKKIVFVLMGLFVILLACKPQTKPTEVTPDAYITKPVYLYMFGTTSDTITNAAADSVHLRIKGNRTYDLTIKLYSDHVSGTAGGTLIGYNSIDGVNYQANGDTITISGVAADAMDAEVISLDNYNYPYYKLIYTQTGTAVTVPRVYVYAKEN